MPDFLMPAQDMKEIGCGVGDVVRTINAKTKAVMQVVRIEALMPDGAGRLELLDKATDATFEVEIGEQ